MRQLSLTLPHLIPGNGETCCRKWARDFQEAGQRRPVRRRFAIGIARERRILTTPAHSRLNKLAAELAREIAAAEGCTPRHWLEALLQYGGSCHRPGSWEANRPFDLQMYLGDDCLADKWF
jgi:hypothetical protein